MLISFENREINDLFKLRKIIEKTEINKELINRFYDKIHHYGLELMRKANLKPEEIITFILKQDIYYYSEEFASSEKRDPEIFKYIPITDEDENYLFYINLIKVNKLWNLFTKNEKMKDKFYNIILSQMKKLFDFKAIFDIFPINEIDKNFTWHINVKMENLIYKDNHEINETIFDIFDNWLTVNFNCHLDIKNYAFGILENKKKISNYFMHLLKSEKMNKIREEIKQSIINYFIFYNNGEINAESLIELLLIANKEDKIYFLNQLDNQVMEEKDFYNKEETNKFLLFKLFFTKCYIYLKDNIQEGGYYLKSIEIKNKILNDLYNNDVPYKIINDLIKDNNIFYSKILLITDNNEIEAKQYLDKFNYNMMRCNLIFKDLDIIYDFYTSFYSTTKANIIILIKNKIAKLKNMNVSEIIKIDKIFEDNIIFNFDEAKFESINIKYKNSCFFMSIYNKNKVNIGIKTEDQIFKSTIKNFKDSLTKIIIQRETKEPFFGINSIEEIMEAIREPKNDLQKEILFIGNEFKHLNKNEYISNDLLKDLINFSQKDKIKNILRGIIDLIEAYNDLSGIQLTYFIQLLKTMNEKLNSINVTGEDIKNSKSFLIKYGYDIEKDSAILDFFGLFIDKKKSILFLKTIWEKNLDARILNELIDESDSSVLQTSDIDNLIYVSMFFNKLTKNYEIKTDENFLIIFKKEFENEKNIPIKLSEYVNSFGQIIQLFNIYSENREMTTEIISNILKLSIVNLYNDETINSYTCIIQYEKKGNEDNILNLNKLDELRNKILLSSSNSNFNNNEDNKEKNAFDKAKLIKDFVNLIDNIKQLNQTMNSLLKSGYFHINNFSLFIQDGKVVKENDPTKDLQKIMEEYNELNDNFKKEIKEGYIKFPNLRLFYGKQLFLLYEKTKNKNIDISAIFNSITMRNINNPNINFLYNNNLKELENINLYLDQLFKSYKISFKDLFTKNKVLPELYLKPGLYRRIKVGDNNDLIEQILNIYQNITGNIPTINTLLLCNEETSIEQIESFLYRALLCDEQILFIISNMECLELSITHELIEKLKFIFEFKNKEINSYILFIYEKIDSGLVRDLEKIIPEKNIFNNYFLKKPEKKNKELQKINLYSSIYSGYGKTTEIKYNVKNKVGIYKYLPIGGSFSRDYIINNLTNLNIDFQEAKKTYIHLDLSETDNDNLMNEILFKLIILRSLDSNKKIYYLGYDINIIIEIPKGFVIFEEKYKLLNLFNKIYIDKLYPLRLEEGVKLIGESPIATVAEVLSFYEQGLIGKKNIDLNSPIKKSAKQCEKIIDKYFNAENQSYYQKMNFIKILAVQFIKFTNNPYFDCSLYDEDDELIEKSRISVISNFIELTKVFTRSPFDGVLLSQYKSMKLFGKYNEERAIEEGIKQLADKEKKREIFSFEKIKPSLVFFNMDGGSLSIITNNNKNDEEYKSLKELWNSQNRKNEKEKELIDYKKLKHNDFLNEIKQLFSLDDTSKDDINNICEKLGNYIFVADNFIKIVRILLNIQAKIPVILMGETGVGKTKLLEMLATLYGKSKKDKFKWHRIQIHAGITDIIIVKELEKIIDEEKNNNDTTWIFFDEINTCNSMGLISEIMCNHSYLGKKIDDKFIFLGACNPYRTMDIKMKESGLVYYNMKEKNKLNNLVYTVNPLPHSLLNFIFDFGSLQPEDEKKYIKNTVLSILWKINDKLFELFGKKKKGKDEQFKNIRDEMIESISICHDYIREIYDTSTVSLREIRRFGIFFEYFMKNFKEENRDKKMKWSLNMTLYLCYYLRINDKKKREELVKRLNKFYEESFLVVPESEIRRLTREMDINEKGIALNRTLKENLFTCFTCIDNNVPIIIIGKPGTGKSLSFQILFNTLKGENSKSPLFRDKGILYRYYYQGSETSTSEGIDKVFKNARKAKKDPKNKNNINLVFFDEMGLAERSSNNPLKVIHFLLEMDDEDSVPFLGISNWRLDAAKINRALNLSITDYDIKDLEETAISIAEALDKNLSNKFIDFFKVLAQTYHEYILFNQNNLTENKDFHGNRDFYNLIKTAMRELIMKTEELNKNENKALTEIGLLSLSRNFGGLENSSTKIKEIFKKLFRDKYDETVEISKGFSVSDSIKKNVTDPNNRYLMLISEGNDANDIAKYLLESIGKKYIELVGTKYKKDVGKYSEEMLNKIKYLMETDNVLILKNLDMIYPSLYDLFNQNFTYMGDKRYARIAFEYSKVSSEVNKDLHIIIIVNQNQIQDLKLDPPFLNRFEKHIINFNMFLEEKDIEIAKNLSDYLKLISSFNNSKKLKISLEKLLINCEQHNIEGLIFKIKNDVLKKEEKNIDHWIYKEGPEYEDNLIKEILKKIVPVFCQDIIASIIILEKKLKKYNKYKEIILDLYKKYNYCNFELFFKNIQKRRNIIYTFSKGNECLFKNDIENKFGNFDSNSIIYGTIESINSENDLTFLLKKLQNRNKKILVLRFTEKNLNRINSINYVINNFHKEIQNLDNKIIIFLIHKQRISLNKKKKIKELPDYISFINDDYYQIFIDNLHGKENLNVLQIMQKKEDLAKEYLQNNDLIEKKIFIVLNYLKYTVLYETKELNLRNITDEISEKIIHNKYIKELINENIKLQGQAIKDIIEDIFISDINEVNDVDFFEVINSKLGSYFCNYLLNIIFFSLKDCILNPLLFNAHYELIMNHKYFRNLISEYFEKANFISKKPKMNINANDITIYNKMEIPKSLNAIEILVQYINADIKIRYLNNEKNLRKLIDDDKIEASINKYKKNLGRYEENIKSEINKIELFNIIYNQNNEEFKKIILNDYFIFFICEYLQKKNIKFEINEKILNFLKLIIKIYLNDFNNNQYSFNYTQDEFIKIILFTQGYKEDIKSLFDIFIDLQKYCDNIVESMEEILKKKEIKYEISTRNKEYTKLVNNSFFNILESLIRSILLYSYELLKDKAKFFEFIYSLTSIEASLQKINKKFFLYCKEIYNIRTLIKIEEAFKNNYESFFDNYTIIMDNMLEQSILFYELKYNNLLNKILELIDLFERLFQEKNEEYINLLFFIYRQQYRNIYEEKIRLELIERYFKNEKLLKKSKLFLAQILKFLKPEVYNEGKNNEEDLLKEFLNLKDEKYKNFEGLINILNNINSPEFNEILLYFLEGQCQLYFRTILNNNKNEYNKKCCEELLLKLSLKYFKKAIEYLYTNKNNYDNNLLKLYSIAYIKTYCFYYVEINFNDISYVNINWNEINKILDDKNEMNESIRKMRNLYIWRLYCKKFDNFDQFENFNFNDKNIAIYRELLEKLEDEKNKPKYIFNNSFITPNNFNNYRKLILDSEKKIDINYNEINQNFDLLYSFFVNKTISYIYGTEKDEVIKKMKTIYDEQKDKLIFGEEGKVLFNYLLNYDLFENNISKKISDKELTQNEFEILLYSLRFIFNSQINNQECFYNNILKNNTYEFIINNYIPGSFPSQTLFSQAYYDIEQKLQRNRFGMGYYVCKDCGFFYEVPPCTFPIEAGKCPSNHDIGGRDHICFKKDIRVFYQEGDFNKLANEWPGHDDWLNSFVHADLKTFKAEYVDKNQAKIKKGIMLSDIKEVEKNNPIRDIHIITFRILHFILYSYLLGSQILGNITQQQIAHFLINGKDTQTLFNIIKIDWELLQSSLNELGIEKNQIFLNMIFEKLIEFIVNLKEVNTENKLLSFEREVDKYITEIISSEESLLKLNQDYKEMNNVLLIFDKNSIREMILDNFDPSVYDQKLYPDIQYYTVSYVQDFNTFIDKFKELKENEDNYFIINTLIKREDDFTKDVMNMKNLININKLSNTLLTIYSFKISREDGKNLKLKNELENIVEKYNEINPDKIKEKIFIENYIEPFIKSWNSIKSKSVQYKCRILRDLEKGELPLDMKIDLPLCYFLVDDGAIDGGMFLASAYQHFIEWQNNFIDIIIENNRIKGIHNSYISQLEQEVNVQEATKDEIIQLDDNIYKALNELIYTTSMRNIISKDNTINYKNYNDIIYDFDYIEEELGKLILLGIKKFRKNKIKFITYLFEGFRGENSSVLVDYNTKYEQRELNDDEKYILNKFAKEHDSNKFNNDVFSSLQILMNEILKENYEKNYTINKVIESLPEYIILNQELKKMFENSSQFGNQQIFSIDTLVPIFEYFEALCWKSIKNNILPDYQLKLPEETKNYVKEYFKNNKDNLININNFTNALRKLISRALTGSREDIEIDPKIKLKLHIGKEEFWPKNMTEKDEFIKQIYDICKDDLIIGNCLELFNSLSGDNILNNGMFLDNNNDIKDDNENEEEEKEGDEQLDNEIREDL